MTARKYNHAEAHSKIEAARAEARRLLTARRSELVTDDEIDAARVVEPLRRAALNRIEHLADSIIPEKERKFTLAALHAYKPLRKRGGQRLKQSDLLVVSVMAHLCKTFDLYRTRNSATAARESAASIVAQVLTDLGFTISEGRVGNIWTT